MIVLFGYGDDPCLELVASGVREQGGRCVVVDQRLANDIDLVLEVEAGRVGGTLTVAGATYPLADLTGVYARPLAPVASPDPRATERGTMLRRAFLEWMDVGEAIMLNRPSSMHSNGSKPFQSQALGAAGFRVPATLISNNEDQVREFWRMHRDVIYKSISGIRSIVRRLDDQSARRLGLVHDLPTQFQELVEGIDVRVHVAGMEVFATEVTSAAVDYRYAARDGLQAELRPTSLPDDVAERCVVLSRSLGLPLSGIDLRRTPDGGYVCFEVNPMPGFAYYESMTGQSISAAVARVLRRETP